MDGPYYATLSHDRTHWIVTSAHDGAMVAPRSEGQLNQFDFTSEALARIHADQRNRGIAEWLAGREEVRIYQALEDRAHSWRRAAEMYERTLPELAADMENNARVMEVLMRLGTRNGITEIAEQIPGYTSMPLPELPED